MAAQGGLCPPPILDSRFRGNDILGKENAGPALHRSGIETSVRLPGYFLGSLGLISFSGMPASLLAMFFFSSMG